jgi:hypothetical protein
MKLLTLIASLILTAQLASATSLHPCTPSVQASPTKISCKEGNVYYSIRIDTTMSPPIEMCRGSNHYENHTATVTFGTSPSDNRTVTIYNDEFTYSLGFENGRTTFKSPKYNMNLVNCATPMHGGFSIGN